MVNKQDNPYQHSLRDSLNPDLPGRHLDENRKIGDSAPENNHSSRNLSDDNRNSAKNSLKNAENSATSQKTPQETPQNPQNTLRTSEKNPKNHLYHPRKYHKQNSRPKKLKNLKKSLPLAVLLAFLGIGGFTLLNSNSLLGPHLSALYTEATDTQTTATLRIGKTLKNTTTETGKTTTEITDSVKTERAKNYYDASAESSYKKRGLSRNIFNNYKQTGDAETDTASYNKTMTKIYDHDKSANINTAEDRTKTTEDGKTETERIATGEDVTAKTTSSTSSTTSDTKTTTTDIETRTANAKNYIQGVTNKVASSVNGVCAAMKVGSMISVAVAANEMYESVHYFMNQIEPISKMMSGNGNTAPINQVLNFFSTPTTSTAIDPDTGEEIKLTGTPLQSENARLVLGGVTPNKTNANRFSLGRLSSAVMASAALTGATANTCNMTRGFTAAIALTATAFGGGFVKSAVGLLLDTTIGTGIQIALSGVLASLVPTVASTLFANTFTDYSGIAAGEVWGRGAAASNFLLARTTSGAMPASQEMTLAYNQLNNETLAKEAEEDRKNRSPLDPTSKNTFLGSLILKFSSLATSFSPLTTLASTLTSPLNTYADGENNKYLTTFNDNCNHLKNLSAGGRTFDTSGDIYCNNITVIDPSILDLTEDDPTYKSVISKSIEIDKNGKEKIIDNSPLAEFITYGVERESPFGFYDANLANACELSLGVVGDNLPFVGKVVDIVNTFKSEKCTEIAYGSRYIASKDNPYWDKEMKYYQYYVIKDRLKSRENSTESAVLEFKDDYYKKHPLDNSDSGYLARISGLTKEDATEVIAYLTSGEVGNANIPNFPNNGTESEIIHEDTNVKTSQPCAPKLGAQQTRPVKTGASAAGLTSFDVSSLAHNFTFDTIIRKEEITA